MHKILFTLAISASIAFAQYKMEPAGAPPTGVAPEVAKVLQPTGTKILNAGGTEVCEVWFRTALPAGQGSTEPNVTFPSVPHGALLGVISFPAAGSDRRGQTLKPGVYTLRYSLYPVNGDHQGVAPQRDFLVLAPAASDTDPNSLPAYDDLMNMSRKASGTPHPAVLSIESPAGDGKIPSLVKEGESDWVLNTNIGNLKVGVILVGTYQG
jgi:hypothetical protein